MIATGEGPNGQPKDPRQEGFRPQRILVTGGCGFIGHHLVRRFVSSARGIGFGEVIVLDDLSTGSLDNLSELPDVKVHVGSVMDPVALRRAIDSVDLIVHLASVVGMKLAVSEQEHAHVVSCEGTRLLMEASEGIPILLVSSSSVYGLETPSLNRETDTLSREKTLAYDGGSPGYATGKLEMELRGLQAASDGRAVMIVRPFNVIGPGQSPAYGMVLPRFLERAREGLTLTLMDDGRQTRCFSDVDTFVDCLDVLIATPRAWTAGQNVFNVGTSESTSIRDLANMVLEETGSRASVQFLPYSKVYPGRRDVRVRVPDVSHLEATIGKRDWPSTRLMVRRLAQRVSKVLETRGGAKASPD